MGKRLLDPFSERAFLLQSENSNHTATGETIRVRIAKLQSWGNTVDILGKDEGVRATHDKRDGYE
jgi:hypothetical protein